MKKPGSGSGDGGPPRHLSERTMMIPLENVSRARPPAGAKQGTSARAALPKPAGAPAAPATAPAEEAPQPRQWRPYRFPRLERVTKQQVALLKRLEWMLPNVRSTGEVSESVQKRLQEMLEETVSLSAEYVHIVPPARVRQYVGEPTFLAILAPQPNKTRGLLEVEIGLAHMVIDMLLGGAGEAVALRPLTDIEEGVMTYLIIETLRALAPSMDPSLPKLRIEGIAKSFEEAMALLGEVENLAIVQLKAVVNNQSGYLRLFIPESVLSTANPPPNGPARRERRAAEARAHATRLKLVKTWLRAEVGYVEIMSSDLQQLRVGDAILVDGMMIRPDKAEGGSVRLKVGFGRTGHCLADLIVENGKYKAKVTEVQLVQQATDGRPAEEIVHAPPVMAQQDDESTKGPVGKETMDDKQPEGADLLNDIPLQIVIELGRVQITGEDVVSLKVGHVLDLNRVAGEPLDLSVNGKVVARGEVVEIEGNLGVRIVALAG